MATSLVPSTTAFSPVLCKAIAAIYSSVANVLTRAEQWAAMGDQMAVRLHLPFEMGKGPHLTTIQHHNAGFDGQEIGLLATCAVISSGLRDNR